MKSALPGLSAGLPVPVLPSLRRLWPQAGIAVAGGLALDGLLRLSHLPSLSSLSAVALLGGGWWLLRPRAGQGPLAALPGDLPGWLERLESLQPRFSALEADPAAASRRGAELAAVRRRLERAGLAVALVGRQLPAAPLHRPLAEALRSRWPLRLHWGQPLPAWQHHSCWPQAFDDDCELLLYHLHWPLAASDLRWLQAIPSGLPTWLLIQGGADLNPDAVRGELDALLGGSRASQLLLWDGASERLGACVAPLAAVLERDGAALRKAARLRALEGLHGRWQAELETLRRGAFQRLQLRTQWLVAAAVVASPLASLDLLALAVANGLMLREMARLWDCPWSAEQLQAAAAELARAALAFGVVDWSTQALAGLARWHGATWLVGGTVQALSAAYLTRVVGRAMADLLARSAGVSEPDLERIRREATLAVAAAAEAEKLDWAGFLQQAGDWLAGAPELPGSGQPRLAP